ncbi:MAG: glycosyltransferase family 2 protein, partial [Thermoleophilia bacterium]|nr:glycosyltransferase family 2 protein [Thermoleophilia bacterium]
MGDAVSLVIPAYNAERFIAGTLESALRQELQAREIIVVDDGSTDATAPLVEAFAPRGVRLIRQSNAGPGAARNAGIAAATSSHVMFLDADDLLFPWSIANALRAAGPGGAAVVLGQPRPFVDESELASVSGGAPTARRFPDLLDALRRWD